MKCFSILLSYVLGWSYHREKKRSSSPLEQEYDTRYPKRKGAINVDQKNEVVKNEVKNGKKKARKNISNSAWTGSEGDEDDW